MANQPPPPNPIATLFGSAQLHYGGVDDLNSVFGPSGYPGIPLSCNAPGSPQGIVWRPNQLQGHGLVIGATRSGKFVCSIAPAALTYSGNLVLIDVKAECAWVTAERRRQLGQRVAILDPFDEINRRYGSMVGVREQTTRYNPLSALDPRSDDFADDVGAIADALIIHNPRDPHWTDSARELVAGLIAAIVERDPSGTASLRQVRTLLTGTDDDLAGVLKTILEKNPDSLAARKLRRFQKTGSNEISSIRSTAETQTAFLDSSPLRDSMETDETPFNLDEISTARVTMYLVLPPDKVQTHGRWLRLIITQLIRSISKQPRPPLLPILFMLDEMGTALGHLEMIENSYGLMAGLGVRIIGYLQDLNQLVRDYKDSWETFVSNSSIIQILNARDWTTSSYFSRKLGNQTLMKTSAPPAYDPQTVFSVGKIADNITRMRSGGIGENDQPLQRPLLFPEEIERIGANDNDPVNNDQLIISPGRWNVRTARIIYYADPRLAGLFRPDPRYQKKAVSA